MGQFLSTLSLQDLLVSVALITASFVVLRVLRPRTRGTALRGPPRGHILFGQSNVLRQAGPEGAARLQDGWATEYGTVFNRPGPFGSKVTMLTDPKAMAHFYGAGETTYEASTLAKRLLPKLTGDGILTAHGEDHKRQRRAMSGGFSNVKMREYTSIFFEAAYKVKATWDQQFENNNSFEMNITPWMNSISLDSMGLAGFSHDFGALSGKTSPLGAAFTKMATTPFTFWDVVTFLLQPVLPILSDIPTERTVLRKSFHTVGGVLARQLLANAAEADERDSKSIMSLLIKSQQAASGIAMSQDEVNAQMRTLMLAGFETTSVSMTWGLIELARNPGVQDALRKELRDNFATSDPTWDELATGLPMLDAVVHETLRLHSAVQETVRQAATDDIIPLSTPITLPNGQMTDHIVVPAGQLVGVPIAAVNRMRSLWGEDAWEFKPQRWLNNGEGIPAAAKDVQGHRNLVTFVNGPRTCLGKNFALAEFKAALSVLIRNYSFELPHGPKTVIGHDIALVPRPTVQGQPRCHVPMRISRVE